jgi:Chaperone of endosialidase/Collagen triple helix repeat (20 copies)
MEARTMKPGTFSLADSSAGGPGSPPNPWITNGAVISYSGGAAIMPLTVPGGPMGPGTLNARGLYIDGVEVEAGPGAVGPEGPAGPIGPPGPTGPEGPAGPQGDPGPQGIQGVDGPQGIQGIQGPEGPEGPEGPQGIEGPEGPAGEIGTLIGEFGSPNADPPDLPPNGLIPADFDGVGNPPTATQMQQGWGLLYRDDGHIWVYVTETLMPGIGWVDGGMIQGPQGIQGIQGPVGPAGPEGPQGIPGAEGPEGPQGPPDTRPLDYLPLVGGTLTGPLFTDQVNIPDNTFLFIGGGNTGDVLTTNGAGALTWGASNNLTGYLPLAGGTMTGPIVLAGNALAPLQAVPLQQLTTAIINALADYLPLAGGTLVGPVDTTSTISIPLPNGFILGGGAPGQALVTTDGNGLLDWDGPFLSAADLATALDDYVLVAGDTMTGPLVINSPTPLRLNTAAGVARTVIGTAGNLNRWQLGLNDASFNLTKYNDAGAAPLVVMDISRANAGSLSVAQFYTNGFYLEPPTNDPSIPIALHLNAMQAGVSRNIYGEMNGAGRWVMQLGDGSAEGVGNTGSNFNIYRYDNTGTQIAQAALTINRNTGNVGFTGGGYTFNGTLTNNSGSSTILLNRASGAPNVSTAITGALNGLSRWAVNLGGATIADPNDGTNTGSDFGIVRYNDNGSDMTPAGRGVVLSINRQTGAAAFSDTVTSGTNASGVPSPGTFIVRNDTRARYVLQNSASAEYGEVYYQQVADAGGLPLQSLGFFHAGSGQYACILNNGRWYANLGYATKFGNAGVGPAPETFNISWDGTNSYCWIGPTSMIIGTVSDYRVKENIETLDSVWENVKALNPVRFTMKDYISINPQGEEIPITHKDNKERWGFIAHELQETLIEDAATNTKDGDSIQSPNLWPVLAALTRALQEAMERIEALENTRILQ